MAIMAVAITVFLVWFVKRPAIPVQATWNDVVAEAETGGYRIIRTDDLYGRFRKDPSNVVMVDTRQPWEYRTGHIEGTLNFPMEPSWWARWLKAGALENFLGPDKNRAVFFY